LTSKHYLKAVEALKEAGDGTKVVAKMKELPTDDPLFGNLAARQLGETVREGPGAVVEVPVERLGEDEALRHLRTAVQAGVYASVLHYLKAVEALKEAGDGTKVVAKMAKRSEKARVPSLRSQ
jgi:hypothetical protein